MPIKRIISQSRCKCSKPEIYLQTDYPLEIQHLQLLNEKGYKEIPRYTNLGILFVSNDDLIVRGAFGSNRLKIIYKKANSSESLDKLEAVLEELTNEKIQRCPKKEKP
jgi:hypothetical protein